MLKAVVEQDHLRALLLFDGEELLYCLHTVAVHHHHRVGEFSFQLQWFVTHIPDAGVAFYDAEAATAPLVSSAEYRHAVLRCKQPDQVLNMRCLPRAAHREVSHTDDRNGEASFFEDVLVEQKVAEIHTSPVQPSQWLQ